MDFKFSALITRVSRGYPFCRSTFLHLRTTYFMSILGHLVEQLRLLDLSDFIVSGMGPPPLRSWARLMGLGNLSFVNQKRIQQANFLYEWTCRMVIKLHHRKVHWSVENPAGSLMWATDPFVALQKAVRDMVAFSFHTCMFKSERKKDTALWTSVRALRMFLERKCDEQHQHLPWGVTDGGGFATAEETAYNETLADVASSENIIMEPSTMYDTSDLHIPQTKQLNKVFLGALPRGRRVPPVMSDLVAEQFDAQHFSFLVEHVAEYKNFR